MRYVPSLNDRPQACTYCAADQDRRAERDRERHIALVDAYFAEPIALAEQGEQHADALAALAAGRGEGGV